ncbi:GTPase/DUF3482 domain-containing protein [Aliidiomarina indica]|uniref:GTPase/DUF3482 domain-containing protein n=1 Tax=Aliidiomarina indica TaxID=2749147 RepID=UPI0018908195|nr:GTPase/DUF3482 domain-containing protein [Aliidiomarina indica]
MSSYEQERPLQIAVVGHTNTGKTSLLRTLLQDVGFGHISDRPATTRDVRAATISSQGKPLITLFDTPGLEDGMGLFAWLEEHVQGVSKHDGPSRIKHFLESAEAGQEFEQEAKVLRQLLVSDAAFYVVDVRDPVLNKYLDELAVLRLCGRPIVPVLNFTAAAAHHTDAWQAAFAQVNLHGWVSFDTVSPPEHGETQLYDHLVAVLPQARSALKVLTQERTREREQRELAALRWLAELIIDVAAAQKQVNSALASEVERATTELQRRVVRHEQSCLLHVLQIYGFRSDDARLADVPVRAGQWQDDLFHPDSLKEFGIEASKGIVAGGTAGAGLDIMTGGLSLGAGTLIGAAAGGIWQGWQRYGQPIQNKLQGYVVIRIENSVLELLAKRQLGLIKALQRRGHAAVEPISTAELTDLFPEQAFQALVKTARKHPRWSALPGMQFQDSLERQRAIDLFIHSTLQETAGG